MNSLSIDTVDNLAPLNPKYALYNSGNLESVR